MTINITHNIGVSWVGQTGQQTIQSTTVLTGNIEGNVNDTLAAAATSPLAVTWTNSKLQDVVILSDQNLTLYTNGVLQLNTATIVGTITGSGNATIVVTASGMTGSPRTVSVAVLNGDTASVVAGKVRTALAADADVGPFFMVGGTGANITLTSRVPASYDSSMNLSSDNGNCTGLTTESTSTNTTHGTAPQDTIAIAAGVPFVWYVGSGMANPFSGNVTGTLWDVAGSTAANLNVRTLQVA